MRGVSGQKSCNGRKKRNFERTVDSIKEIWKEKCIYLEVTRQNWALRVVKKRKSRKSLQYETRKERKVKFSNFSNFSQNF